MLFLEYLYIHPCLIYQNVKMESQLFHPAVLLLIIATDSFAIYDLLRNGRDCSVWYKVLMTCVILLVPLLGVSVYYATKHSRTGRRRSVPVLSIMGLSLILFSIMSSCSKETDDRIAKEKGFDQTTAIISSEENEMGRIRMELSMMKSDSYVALFDALIEEHYTDPTKMAEIIQSDDQLTEIDKMLLEALINDRVGQVEIRSGANCEWERKKSIAVLTAKCCWDIAIGRDADKVVKEATEELQRIHEEYQACSNGNGQIS